MNTQFWDPYSQREWKKNIKSKVTTEAFSGEACLKDEMHIRRIMHRRVGMKVG